MNKTLEGLWAARGGVVGGVVLERERGIVVWHIQHIEPGLEIIIIKKKQKQEKTMHTGQKTDNMATAPIPAPAEWSPSSHTSV